MTFSADWARRPSASIDAGRGVFYRILAGPIADAAAAAACLRRAEAAQGRVHPCQAVSRWRRSSASAAPHSPPTERAFFRDADPLGFILFARNCAAPAQVRRLVAELRDTVGRARRAGADRPGRRAGGAAQAAALARLSRGGGDRCPGRRRGAGGSAARRAPHRRRSRRARHHRRLHAGARSAGRRRGRGDRRPRLRRRRRRRWPRSALRCARGFSPAAWCRSSSTSPAMAGRWSTAIARCRW